MKRFKQFAVYTTSTLACTFMCGCDLSDAAADGLYAAVSDLVSRIVISIATGQPLT